MAFAEHQGNKRLPMIYRFGDNRRIAAHGPAWSLRRQTIQSELAVILRHHGAVTRSAAAHTVGAITGQRQADDWAERGYEWSH
jgi:hypothetical protein